MKLQDSVVLVTGANRGLGEALVRGLLARGAKKVYAAARDPKTITASERVTPIALDVTDPDQVAAAAARTEGVTLVINNAGSLASYGVLAASMEQLETDLRVNATGPLLVARAFAPQLEQRGGAIVNVLSVVSLANMPSIGGYSASKAAAFSLTQALRGDLAPKGVAVFAAFPGPIDTQMVAHMPMVKTSPDAVAKAILDGVEAGQLDIAPDPMAAQAWAGWTQDPQALARQFAG